MTNYREILRLKKLGLNNSQIAQSLGCSCTTVIQVLSVTDEKGISYPLPEDLSDRMLSELLFPSDKSKPEFKMPDCQTTGLKKEYFSREEYATINDVANSPLYYVEIFYNRKRLHSYFGDMSPLAYRIKKMGL